MHILSRVVRLLGPALLIVLLLPCVARAAITPTRTAADIATAMATSSSSSAITGSAFTTLPDAEHEGSAAVSDVGLAAFPRDGGTYGILSTGAATSADDAEDVFASTSLGGNQRTSEGSDYDVTVLRVDLNVPQGVNCMSIAFRFLSEEYPSFVGSNVNDAFIAELDPATPWTTSDGDQINAPDNFAFDGGGRVISINTTGSTQMSAAHAAGTPYGGATPLLSAARAITPGAHALYLSIFDQGDTVYDSSVLLDRLLLFTAGPGGCASGAQVDDGAPAVTLDTPATGSTTADSTPTLGGTAGAGPGDSNSVTVRIWSGTSTAGEPLHTLQATRSGGSWAIDAPELAPGTYIAQAEQTDSSGNVGARRKTRSRSPPRSRR
jgi:hypothetical protein